MSEELLSHQIIELIAQTLGFIGVAFIVAGTLIAFLQYLDTVFIRRLTMPNVQFTLGTYILVGLEFMVGQDIVETVINTEFEHLVGLGMIVVIRTVLEYFLGKEVEHLAHETAHEGEHRKRSDSEHGESKRAWWPQRRHHKSNAFASVVHALQGRKTRKSPPPSLPRSTIAPRSSASPAMPTEKTHQASHLHPSASASNSVENIFDDDEFDESMDIKNAPNTLSSAQPPNHNDYRNRTSLLQKADEMRAKSPVRIQKVNASGQESMATAPIAKRTLDDDAVTNVVKFPGRQPGDVWPSPSSHNGRNGVSLPLPSTSLNQPDRFTKVLQRKKMTLVNEMREQAV
ncbi:MAG: DUF1622 domain-containing protein [Proteobacteria bacterium]|nr:DUF1622 domain-containing protein [Pseudomonadota bacterium]